MRGRRRRFAAARPDRRALALGCAVAVGAGAAAADPAPPASMPLRIEIVACGSYSPSPREGRLPAPYRQNSIVDVTLAAMPRLIARTERIEARACTRFGLEYRAANLEPSETAIAEVRVAHPVLTRPDGRRSSLDSYEIPLRTTTGWTGFDFDEAWQIAPGPWTFSFVHGGRVLAQQRFVVSAPPPGVRTPTSCIPAVA